MRIMYELFLYIEQKQWIHFQIKLTKIALTINFPFILEHTRIPIGSKIKKKLFYSSYSVVIEKKLNIYIAVRIRGSN